MNKKEWSTPTIIDLSILKNTELGTGGALNDSTTTHGTTS